MECSSLSNAFFDLVQCGNLTGPSSLLVLGEFIPFMEHSTFVELRKDLLEDFEEVVTEA